MTITHHPSDETLLEFTTGSLAAGHALVVAVHLEGCEHCSKKVSDYKALGGLLIEESEPERLSPTALADVLARMDRSGLDLAATGPGACPRHLAKGVDVPMALQHCAIESWRWLSPGFRWSRVRIPGCPDAKVMLLRGDPGLRLPRHGHTGVEMMQVLRGSLYDERGHFHAGDLDEADVDVDHQPIVDRGSECICLAAVDGETRLHSWPGRLMQRLVGF